MLPRRHFGEWRMTLRSASLILFLTVIGWASRAQEVPFPFTVFLERDSLARELLRYDACAWRSSDALLQNDTASLRRLGPEWLCYRRSGRWNAVFGRFDTTTDRYDIVVHYVLTDTLPGHSSEPLDTAAVTASARALHQAAALVPGEFTTSKLRFNQYVLPTSIGLVVWILPAWQPSGVAVFGGEAELSFDSTGHHLQKQRAIPGPLRGFQPDSTVEFRIDSNTRDDVPTVGDLFFYYLVRRHFKKIRIKTGKYSSSLVPTDSGEVWVHVVLDK